MLDLVTLGSGMHATNLVQGWRSCIWAERYADPGDFQLQTLRVDETRSLIPPGSYVGLIDSPEVMLVESHEIGQDPETGRNMLTVTGRSAEVLGEQRMTYRLGTSGASGMVEYPISALVIGSQIVQDLYMIRLNQDAFFNPDARNRVVDFDGASYHPDFEANIPEDFMDFKVPVADIHSVATSYLKSVGAGLRTIRHRYAFPPFGTGGGYFQALIVGGYDRTVNQTDREPVIFTTMQDHLIDEKYLWTLRNYKNFAQVVSPIYDANVFAPGVSTATAGKDLRVLHVDASDITSAGGGSASSIVRQRGLAELAKNNQIFFFEGQVNPDSPYKRGLPPVEGGGTSWYEARLRRTTPGDYDLGDLVTLMGKYGVSQTMRVTEFVRTQDETGYREYPTLSQPVEVAS